MNESVYTRMLMEENSMFLVFSMGKVLRVEML
jgi:hypothetical protein